MIKSNKLVDLVKGQFEDPNSIELDADTNFKNLEDFDSLTGMCIIVAINDEFGVEISADKFKNALTVNDLQVLIETN